jgi:hypothetical protein
MEQGLDVGRRAVAPGTQGAGWGGPHRGPGAAAPASAAAAGLGLGGRRSPPPEGSYSPEGRYSPPPRGSPQSSPQSSPRRSYRSPSCGDERLGGADDRHVLRVPVLELPPPVQTAPAPAPAPAPASAPAPAPAPARPQPRRAEQAAAPEAGCVAAAAGEGARAVELPSHLAGEVEVTVTASGGAPGSGLTRGRLPGAMTPCVDSGGSLRWVRPTLSASGGALAAAVDSASQAKGLVYVSFKQARCTASWRARRVPACSVPAACLQRACSVPAACLQRACSVPAAACP